MTELTPEDIYNIILEILSGERITCTSSDHKVILIQPDYKQKLMSEFIESTNLRKYIKEGMCQEKDIPQDFIDEFFSAEEQENLEEVESKIRTYKTLLSKRIKGSEQYTKDQKQIKALNKEKTGLLNKKASAKQYTAEYRAREDKHFYLLSECCLDFNRQKIWTNYETLMGDDTMYNSIEVYSFLNCFLEFYFGYQVSTLRKVARSATWRTYYISSKEGVVEIFTRKGPDLSLDQLNLIGWSKWYDSIFDLSHKDRPSEETLEDDDKADKFVEEYIRRLYAGESTRSDSGKAMDKDHVIVTAESQDYVKFQKQGKYSDTAIISGKSKEDSTSYDETKEVKRIKKKLRGA